MRVTDCILSTAEVNPYNGKEIPGWDKMGLDPNKVYRLYRTPDLLGKLVSTVNGNPIMVRHIPNTADEPNHEFKGGAVHSAKFDGKHLRGDLLLDDSRAIDLVESKKQADLSLGYRYKPVMMAGVTPEGQGYDGLMEWDGGGSNHLALVDNGRATGAHVNDHAHQPITQDNVMPTSKKVQTAENRDDPANANVTDPAKNPNANGQEAGTTTQPAPGSPNGEENEQANLSAIGEALKHIANLLEDIHGRLPGESQGAAPMNANDKHHARDKEHEAEDRRHAHDAELKERYSEDRRRRAYDSEHEKLSEEEKKAEDRRRAHDAEIEKRGAEDARRRAYDEAFEPEEAGSQEGTGARGNKTPHGAMDAASVSAVVDAAVKAERERGRAVEEAKQATRHVLGDVYGLDDAGDIYLQALKHKGVDLTHITKETAKVAWTAFESATAQVHRAPAYAQDRSGASNDASAATGKNLADLASRISVKG